MEKDKNQTITDAMYILQGSISRIADALEEILRLVKLDQAKTAERMKELEKIFIKDAPLEERKEFVKKIEEDNE